MNFAKDISWALRSLEFLSQASRALFFFDLVKYQLSPSLSTLLIQLKSLVLCYIKNDVLESFHIVLALELPVAETPRLVGLYIVSSLTMVYTRRYRDEGHEVNKTRLKSESEQIQVVNAE